MSDKYGNYFCKKLIQVCLPSQRIKILNNLGEDFINISKDSHGTHPLQFLIETINMPEEKNIVLNYIINNEYDLAIDQKGTNVLKKFIICTKGEERTELNNNIIKIIDKLIINQHGSIILIFLIKNTKNKDIYKQIAQYISYNNPLYYVQHPYSNYVVQALLHFSDLEFCEEIIKTVINNYLILSLKKNSNKVVEYCIKSGKSSVVKKIFNNVIEKNNLEYLINNCYGNYVLEKLITKLNRDEKHIVIKKLEELGMKEKIPNSIKNLLEK
jgi:pumilio RNA-binding family